jgi:hypothetical protein
MKKDLIIYLFGCIFLLSSCSAVKFYSDSTLKTETGIKIYTAKPYILVTQVKDSTTAKVIYLPDLINPQYVKLKSGIGTSNLSLTLANGILTSYGLSTDTKIPETITSATGLLTELVTAIKGDTIVDKNASKPVIKRPDFELYEFIPDKDNTVKLQKVTINK